MNTINLNDTSRFYTAKDVKFELTCKSSDKTFIINGFNETSFEYAIYNGEEIIVINALIGDGYTGSLNKIFKSEELILFISFNNEEFYNKDVILNGAEIAAQDNDVIKCKLVFKSI